ncbi:AAA family ATPase [Paraburkholderia rhizosphaerae]|uniref:Pilus assembly protein CpaE n=1 Tax=Paraburkholderia rhizosphaerae TaxID=480658 RepID=A0A4R8LVP1_9BURK|nr:AAA family ATPase [Paraburkholderia rhizosphaerae]TDY51658.1 pilus assembly protein CpaE [Paraburkholderia rhizosphaerae]
MIDILLVSASDACAAQITAMLRDSGVAHTLRNETGAARALAKHASLIRKADLLIIEDSALAAADLAAIEEASAQAPNLSCMLVTAEVSTDMLKAAMRAGVRHVLSWPLDATAFARELAHVASKKNAHTRRAGRVLAFAAGKGGCGTTLLTANVGYALAASRDKRVLLIDLNQQFADANLLLSDKAPPATLYDLATQIDRLDAAFFEACVARVHPNLDVLAGAGDPVKAAELRASHLQRVLALVRDQYDIVLCDVGQSINPLSIHVLDQSDAVGVVLQQSVPHLHATRRLLDLFGQLGYASSKTRLIVNHYDKRAQVGLDAIERTLGTKPAHLLPHDATSAGHAVNQGVPLHSVARNGALTKSIDALATLLCPLDSAPEKRMFARLFAAKPDTRQQLKPSH